MASTDKKEPKNKSVAPKKTASPKKANAVKTVVTQKKAVSPKTSAKTKTESKQTVLAPKKTGARKTPDASLKDLMKIPAAPGDVKQNKESDKEAEDWFEKKLTTMASSGKKTSAVQKKEEDDEHDIEAIERGDIPKGLVEHLGEFRSRLMFILGMFMALTVAAFYFSEHIVNFINAPFLETGQKLNMFKLMGGFLIRLKASALIAFLIMIPVIIFQIWKFTAPAIKKTSRRFSVLSIIAAILLFYSGCAFVFFLLVPMMIPILTQFIPTEMLTTIGADDYLSFVVFMTIAMGILFEMPIVVLVLTRIGVISPQFLISKRKIAIVIIFIVSAMVTPQDPLSIFFAAVPLMFLYELSIFISRYMLKHLAKAEKSRQK